MGGYGGSSMMFIERESSVYSVVWLEYQKQPAHVNAAAFRLTAWASLEETLLGNPQVELTTRGQGCFNK